MAEMSEKSGNVNSTMGDASKNSPSPAACERIIRNANIHFSPPLQSMKSSNMLSFAQQSVSSANEILVGIEHDLKDAKKILHKRNLHNQNLEELVMLLKKENAELHDDLACLERERKISAEMHNKRESELLDQIEENRLACEGEIDRVLMQHQQAVAAMKAYQSRLQEYFEANKEFEAKMSAREQETFMFHNRIAQLSSQLAQANAKIDDLKNYNKVLENAHEELYMHKQEKITRAHEHVLKEEKNYDDVLQQLQQHKARIRDLEFENTLLKASLHQGSNGVVNPAAHFNSVAQDSFPRSPSQTLPPPRSPKSPTEIGFGSSSFAFPTFSSFPTTGPLSSPEKSATSSYSGRPAGELISSRVLHDYAGSMYNTDNITLHDITKLF